jgi:hypothetical protein
MAEVLEHILPMKHKHADLVGVLPDQHHRQWGWADEQTWSKLYHIPLAFGSGCFTKLNGGNPVLVGSASWETNVAHPSVVKLGNYYYLAYVGWSAGGASQIGIARSTDKINWTKSSDNPIIRNDQTWKANGIAYMSMMIDRKWGYFIIFYDGRDSVPNRRLGYATCPVTSDPLVRANWTDYSGNPVYDLGANSCYGAFGAMKLGGAYYLIVGNLSTSVLRLILSPNRNNWTLYGDVDTLGASGSWDDYGHAYPTCFWNLGVFYLVYAGQRSTTKYQFGLELALGDGSSFTKLWGNKANPIFSHDAGATDTISPSLMMEGQSFYMWYCSYATGTPSIYLAKLDLDYQPS